MERFRRLFKEGFWVILGQVMAVFGSLVGVRILTGLMDPSAYGELALGMTAATLVNQSVLGPLGGGILRFYAPAVEQADLGGYLKAVRRLALSATGIIVLFMSMIIFVLLISGRMPWAVVLIAATIFAVLSGYNAILSGIQNAARQRSIVALHQGAESWIRFLVAAGLMLYFGATSVVAMMGYSLAVLLVLGSQSFFFQKVVPVGGVNKPSARSWQKQMWDFSWPISVFGMFTWMQLVSDRWALGVFATTKDVGLYAALFQIGYYPMSMVTGTAMQFFAPIFYQQSGDACDTQRNARVKDLSWSLTLLALAGTGVVSLAAFLFHGLIFKIFVAGEYVSVSYLLPWMLLAGGIFAAGQMLALNLQSQMKTRVMMTAKIVTALLGVILNIAGAYWYGTAGIVAASILFSVSFFIWMAMLLKKEEQGCL
jgi:O-antigen/teichoic acid export membrane protein